MKALIVAVVLGVAGLVLYQMHERQKADEANRQKIDEEVNRLERLTKSLQKEDALLADKLRSDEAHKAALAKTLQDKKNQINNLQAQLSQFVDTPDLVQKKAAADAYVKKERDKVKAIEDEIKSLEAQKRGSGGEVQAAQKDIDYSYHQQDANLAQRIKLEEQTLQQLKTQLSQTHVDKHDPASQDDYNSQKQAIANQQQVIANFKQQKIDLAHQRNLAHDNVNITNGENKSEIDTRIAVLRNDDATEKKYLDQAERAYRDLTSTSDRSNAQSRDIQNRIQILKNEVHDLELVR